MPRRPMKQYKDASGKARGARLVDPDYLFALEATADLAAEIVDKGMTGGRIVRLEGLLAVVDSLEPRQNKHRTDPEVEGRL